MRAKLVYVWNLAEEVAMFGLKFVVKKSVKTIQRRESIIKASGKDRCTKNQGFIQ